MQASITNTFGTRDRADELGATYVDVFLFSQWEYMGNFRGMNSMRL